MSYRLERGCVHCEGKDMLKFFPCINSKQGFNHPRQAEHIGMGELPFFSFLF